MCNLIGCEKSKNSIKAIGRDKYPELKGECKTMEFRKLTEGGFRYEIAQNGTCRNVKSKHILSPDWSGGYGRYTFTIEGRKEKHLVHRLVLSAWGSIPDKYLSLGLTKEDLQVNHKDGNKENNHISNLEYVTAKENIHHRDKVLGKNNQSDGWENQKYPKKKVLCVETNILFESSYDAANWLIKEKELTSSVTVVAGCIRQCCRGESKTSRGFHWKFYNS